MLIPTSSNKSEPTSNLLVLLFLVFVANANSAEKEIIFDLNLPDNQTHLIAIDSPLAGYHAELRQDGHLVSSHYSSPSMLNRTYFLLTTNNGKNQSIKHNHTNLIIRPNLGEQIYKEDIHITTQTIEDDMIGNLLVDSYVNHQKEQDLPKLIKQIEQKTTSAQENLKCQLLYTKAQLLGRAGQFEKVGELPSISKTPSSNKFCQWLPLLLADLQSKLYQFEASSQIYFDLTSREKRKVKKYKTKITSNKNIESPNKCTTFPTLNTWPELKIPTFINMGLSHTLAGFKHGNTDRMELGKSALDCAHSLLISRGNLSLKADLYNALAAFHSSNNMYLDAANYLEMGIALKEEMGTASKAANLYNNLALVHMWTGQLAKAQKSMRKTLALAEQNDDPLALSRNLANMAKSYWLLGNLKAAERYYQRSMMVAREESQSTRLSAQLALARIAHSQNEHEKAIAWAIDAEHAAKVDRPEKLSVINSLQSQLYAEYGDQNFALHYVEQAQKKHKQSLRITDKQEVWMRLARSQLTLNDKSAAQYFIKKAEQVTDKYHPASVQLAVLKMDWIERYGTSQQKQLDQMQTVFDHAMSVVAAVNDTLNFKDAGPQWLSHVRKLVNKYVDYLFLTGDKSQQLHALEILDLYQINILERSRTFYRQYSDKDTFFNKELWKKKIDAELGILLAKNNNQRRKAIADHDQISETWKLQSTGQPFRAEKAASNLAIQDYLNKLSDKELVLRFVMIGDKIHTFAAARHRQMFSTQSIPGLKSRLEKLSDHSSPAEEAEVISEMLATAFPTVLLQNPNLKKLIIIPDGLLQKAPFSAIRLPISNDGTETYLAEHFEVVRSYSIEHYLSGISLSEPHDQKTSLAVFANPMFHEGTQNTENEHNYWNNLPSLPWSMLEAEAIVGSFGSSNAAVFVHDSATSEALMSKTARESDIFHIATHGYFNKQHPEIVGLVTAPSKNEGATTSGFLSLSQWLSAPISSKLVVLSGCETMLGEMYASDGYQGLARGVIAQGAGSVIGTLWKVPDKATALFMRNFYAHLKETQNSAAALKAARNDFISSGRYRNPFYWAGFVLIVVNQSYEIF